MVHGSTKTGGVQGVIFELPSEVVKLERGV